MNAGSTDVASNPVPPNPLLEGLDGERLSPPAVLVIFGATGDPTRRKLIPALKRLAFRRELSGAFGIVGVGRTEMDSEGFRQRVSAMAGEEGDGAHAWADLLTAFSYVAGDYAAPTTFERLAHVLAELDETRGTAANRLFYLATPPSTFSTIIASLARHRLNQPVRAGAFVRIIVEKPFGRDLRSAEELDRQLHTAFAEEQIYRIDHYLGKETVQNLLALRFANTIFEPVWNRRYVDHIQITAAESEGVGARGAFYEEAGALRDIVQNHVLQVLSLILMEPPVTVNAEGIRDEKVKALRAVDILTPEEVATAVVRARYVAGRIHGQEVRGYREEEHVDPEARRRRMWPCACTWITGAGPACSSTSAPGKRLPKRVTEVAIQFQRVPYLPFQPTQVRDLEPDALSSSGSQPDEGITLRFGGKVPGPRFQIRSVSMDMLYGSAFLEETTEAYERLLLDALTGDQQSTCTRPRCVHVGAGLRRRSSRVGHRVVRSSPSAACPVAARSTPWTRRAGAAPG
jgi:glucose-6-phosphate 1-dehydrogenase